MKTGFFESSPGNRSSSRLIGAMVILVALIFAQEILYAGLHASTLEITATATAAGVIFTTVAGPAMAFLFFVKRNENKSSNDNNSTAD